MKLSCTLLFLMLPFGFAALAVPAQLAMARSTGTDAGIYLVATFDPQTAEDQFSDLNITPFGPQRARFGVFVTAGPDERNTARQLGYVLIPAAAIARICGLTPSKDASL